MQSAIVLFGKLRLPPIVVATSRYHFAKEGRRNGQQVTILCTLIPMDLGISGTARCVLVRMERQKVNGNKSKKEVVARIAEDEKKVVSRFNLLFEFLSEGK